MRHSKRQVRGQRDKHLRQKWGHEIICPAGEDTQCRGQEGA